MENTDLRALVRELFLKGDTRERCAVLRSLSVLPDPAQYLDTAIEACRTNVQPVFEAIACENRYPAKHFPELNFNQMVLKALFIGIPLERIFDLKERITPELVRMAKDYASERRAAGRSIPSDVELVTGEGSR